MDVAAIERVRQQALVAMNEGDVERLLTLLGEDIVLMRSGDTTLVGYGPVADHLREFFSRVDLELSRQEPKVVLYDEWAMDHNTLTGTWRMKRGGRPHTINVRVTDLFKLQYDDSWKYERVMGFPSLDSGQVEETAVESGPDQSEPARTD